MVMAGMHWRKPGNYWRKPRDGEIPVSGPQKGG